jgi:ABC-type lipoprotein export system ATPase subunit
MVTHEHEIADQTEHIIAIRDGLVEVDKMNGRRQKSYEIN